MNTFILMLKMKMDLEKAVKYRGHATTHSSECSPREVRPIRHAELLKVQKFLAKSKVLQTNQEAEEAMSLIAQHNVRREASGRLPFLAYRKCAQAHTQDPFQPKARREGFTGERGTAFPDGHWLFITERGSVSELPSANEINVAFFPEESMWTSTGIYSRHVLLKNSMHSVQTLF